MSVWGGTVRWSMMPSTSQRLGTRGSSAVSSNGNPVFCACCGLSGTSQNIEVLAVERRHPETDHVKVAELALCEACRRNENRAWRWRWEPVEADLPRADASFFLRR